MIFSSRLISQIQELRSDPKVHSQLAALTRASTPSFQDLVLCFGHTLYSHFIKTAPLVYLEGYPELLQFLGLVLEMTHCHPAGVPVSVGKATYPETLTSQAGGLAHPTSTS